MAARFIASLTRLVVLALVTLALVAPAHSQSRPRAKFPDRPSAEGQALYDLRMGFQRLSTGDPRGAVELLTRAIDSGVLPAQPLASAYFFRGAAWREQSRFREAMQDLNEAARRAPDKGQIPVLAFDVALRMDQMPVAFTQAMAVASSFPEETKGLSFAAVVRVTEWLAANRRTADEHKLRAALFNANYQGGGPRGSADSFYRDLVDEYLQRSDVVNAVRVASSLTSVDVLLDLLIDRRYEELWEAVQANLGGSLDAAARRQADVWRAAAQADPGDPQLRHTLVEALRLINQPAEAVRAAEPTLRDPLAVGRDASAYFWVLAKTAYAEAEAGRPDAGLARWTELDSFRLDDYPDLVTHLINRAAMQIDLGQFADAKATIAKVDVRYLSVWGRGWLRALEVCSAYGAAGAKAGSGSRPLPEAAAPLAALRDANRANASAYQYALLCANRMDEAEQWMIRRLGDPELRMDALQALQRYARGANESPHFQQMQERLAKLRDRPKVKAALTKVGRVLDVPLPRTVLTAY